jgi:hypothetical protein
MFGVTLENPYKNNTIYSKRIYEVVMQEIKALSYSDGSRN